MNFRELVEQYLYIIENQKEDISVFENNVYKIVEKYKGKIVLEKRWNKYSDSVAKDKASANAFYDVLNKLGRGEYLDPKIHRTHKLENGGGHLIDSHFNGKNVLIYYFADKKVFIKYVGHDKDIIPVINRSR